MDRENGKDLDRFAVDFINVVEKHAKYAVVSGFVAVAHGRSRATEDVDIIIEHLPEEKFAELHEELVENGFRCIQSDRAEEIYDDYLSEDLSVRYVKGGNHIPQAEVKFSKDELDDYQLETRKKLPMTGFDLYFSSVEVNIAFKEELLGSDKDIADAEHLRVVYGDKLDEKEIEKVKKMLRELRLK